MRRFAKIALLIGAIVIALLLALFFYVSGKVKSEIEDNLNAYVEDLKQNGMGIDFVAFKCKGFLHYKCQSKSLKITNGKELLFEFKNFLIGFRDISTKTMQEYIKADIVLPYHMPNDFKPYAFEYQSVNKIVNDRDGEVLMDGKLLVKTKAAWFVFNGSIKEKSDEFVNKNIIKIITQSFLRQNTDLKFHVQDLHFQTQSKGLQESFYSYLEQKNQGDFDREKYDAFVDEDIKNIGFLMGMLGVFSSPYKDAFLNALDAYADLLKGRISAVKMNLLAKDEKYLDWKSLNFESPNAIQRFLATIFNHYDMNVTLEPLAQ